MAVNIGPRIGIDGEAEYRRQINEITQAQKALAAEMRATESAFDKNGKAQKNSGEKAKNLAKQIELQKKKVDELKKGLEQASAKWGEDSAQVSKWRQAVAGAEETLNKLNKELNEVKPSAGERLQEAGKSISGFGQKITTVGDTMTKYISAPIAGVGAVAVKTAMDFEDSMAKVQTIADTTSVPIDDLRGAIMDLSSDTGIAATDIADSVYNAISAGQDTASAVSFVETTAKLAKAGFTDTASALDVLTSTMNAYHLEASEAGSVSDKLITVQNRGKTTIAQLSSSMGKVIPTASAFGVSLDNVASAYVVLTKNGISTAESTTYMNSMLNELGKSGTKASEIIKKQTGKSFSELMESGSNVSDVLKILKEEADKSNLSLADMFGSAEAGKAALSIMSDGGEEFNASMKAMQESAGATQTAFDTISGTTSEKFKRAMNELKNTGIRAGTDLITMAGPGIDAFGKKISDISKWYKNLSSDTQRTISTVGVAFAVGGPLLSGVGRVVDGFGKGVTAVGKFVSLIGGLSSPGGAVLLGAAALGTLAAAMLLPDAHIGKIEGYDDFIKDLDQIKAKIKSVKDESARIGSAVSGMMTGVTIDAAPLEELYKQIKDCYDENGNLKEGMEETAAYLVGEFDSKMGTDFSTQFGQNAENNIQSLENMNKALDDYIEKLKQSAVQNAFNEQYGAAVLNQANAATALADAQTKQAEAAGNLQTAAENLATANRAVKDALENGTSATVAQWQAVSDATTAYDNYTKELEEANQAVIDAGGAAETADAQVRGMEEAISAIAKGDTEKGVQIMGNLEGNALKAGEAFKKNLVPAFNTFMSKVRKFRKESVNGFADIAPTFKVPDVTPTAKKVVDEFTGFFKKNSPTLSLRNSTIIGAAEKGNEAKSILTKFASGFNASIGGVIGATTAATNARSSMQSIFNSPLSAKVSTVSGWLEAVSSAWSNMQAWFNSNPLVSYVQEVVQTIRDPGWNWSGLFGSGRKKANGGFVTSPEISLIGEAGPEVVIPLSPNRRNRAINLYRQAGAILGAGNGGTVNNQTTNMGGININVYAQPGQNINQIANEVSRRINAEVFRKGAVYR